MTRAADIDRRAFLKLARRRHRRPRQPRAVGAARPGAAARYPDRPQRLPPDRRGRPRHRLLRQDRDGPGRHDVAGADGGRGARRRPRLDRHGPRRHRPLPVGHGDVRLADHAHVRPRAPRRPAAEARAGPAAARLRAARRAAGPARRSRTASSRSRATRRARSPTAQLAKGQTIVRTVDEKAVLRAVPRVHGDGRARRSGSTGATRSPAPAQYAADIRLPGMLYARVLRPPAHGATLAKVDTSAAAKRGPASRSCNQDGLVAVLHADPEAAEAALGAHQGRVDRAAARDPTRTHLRRAPRQGAPRRRRRSAKGDVAATLAAATRRFEQHVPEGLRGPRADGAAHRSSAAIEDGKADGLGLDADAVPDARPPRPGPRPATRRTSA